MWDTSFNKEVSQMRTHQGMTSFETSAHLLFYFAVKELLDCLSQGLLLGLWDGSLHVWRDLIQWKHAMLSYHAW